MIETGLVYALTGVVLAGLGLHAAIIKKDFVRRILAINVLSVGVFLILIAFAWSGNDQLADPVPHALVLTGIVVGVSATALGLALERRRRESDDA